jgi:hypothetical protein
MAGRKRMPISSKAERDGEWVKRLLIRQSPDEKIIILGGEFGGSILWWDAAILRKYLSSLSEQEIELDITCLLSMVQLANLGDRGICLQVRNGPKYFSAY